MVYASAWCKECFSSCIIGESIFMHNPQFSLTTLTLVMSAILRNLFIDLNMLHMLGSNVSPIFFIGFTQCRSHHSLFIYWLASADDFLLYVDDIILMTITHLYYYSFIDTLGKESKVKWSRSFTLPFRSWSKFSTANVHHSKLIYAIDLLRRFFMIGYKPCAILVYAKTMIPS